MPQEQPLGTYEVKEFKDADFQTTYTSKGGYVRFWVESPMSRTNEGEDVKLHPGEGWIDVLVTKEGHLEVRGAHRLGIKLHTSNVCEIGLADH